MSFLKLTALGCMKFQAYQPSLSVNRVSDWALQSSVTWQVTNDMLWILISHYMIGLANEHIMDIMMKELVIKGFAFKLLKKATAVLVYDAAKQLNF